MTQSIDVHVEGGAGAMAQRFVTAWHQAERGEPIDGHHLSFESWEVLVRALWRDPGQVAADAAALTEAGLINRSKAGLRADHSEIRARIAV